MGPEQPVGNAVKGAKPEAPSRNIHHLLNAVAHFLRRFVGEGHREYARRRHLVHLHEPGNPVHQHPGFATARTCQHQQMIILGRYSLTLGVVQGVDNVGDIHRDPVATG